MNYNNVNSYAQSGSPYANKKNHSNYYDSDEDQDEEEEGTILQTVQQYKPKTIVESKNQETFHVRKSSINSDQSKF